MRLYVKEIWRYPVKSMAGERLSQAPLTRGGIAGDRVILVADQQGRIVTARSRPGLLGHHATTAPDGTPLVDGRPWTDPSVLADVRKVAGPGARLFFDETAERFDVLPLLVATDGAIKSFGRDGRRLRPNLVIGGVEGLAERDWPGKWLRIGDAIVRLHSLRGRCIMTTYDPDTLHHDPFVLRDIVDRFQGKLAMNSSIERGGVIQEGQPVELLDAKPV